MDAERYSTPGPGCLSLYVHSVEATPLSRFGVVMSSSTCQLSLSSRIHFFFESEQIRSKRLNVGDKSGNF